MAKDNERSPLKVMLKNVRLSFPSLWKAKSFRNGEGEPKFQARFLMDPETSIGKANIAKMEDAIDHAIANHEWKGKTPKFKEDKLPLRDGDGVDADGYEGMMFVAASNGRAPKVLDRDKLDVRDGDDDAPYAGCFVDAAVRVWVQDNEYGKRINASLEAVRFRADGEGFGAGQFDVDDFDELDDDDDDRGSRRSSKRSRDEDDDDRGSRRSSKRSRDEDDDDDDRGSRRSSKRSRDEDDEEEKPRSRRGSKRDEEDEDDDRGSRRSSKRSRDDEDDEEEKPRSRRGSKRDEDDEEEKPRSRRGSKRDEDDDDNREERRGRRSSRRDDDDI